MIGEGDWLCSPNQLSEKVNYHLQEAGRRLPAALPSIAIAKRSQLIQDHGMPHSSSRSVARLIRQAEGAARGESDPVAILVAVTKLVIKSDADPYCLAGAMIEGLATTIATKLPPERRGEVSVEAVRMLRDRLRATGAI
jgi:hypothetical protein